jgi:hypothetical protein
VFKQSEAAKAALRKPLDGDQGKLLGSLEGWLHAQQQVAHYRQETVIELEKMKGEMAVEYLPWAPSITAREVELKRAEAGEKTAADARAKNEKEKETLTQALKHAEVTDKVKQSLQAESIKAMSDASNSLRDARSRVGTKQREWLEAVFQHERYRVQKRVVLGFE